MQPNRWVKTAREQFIRKFPWYHQHNTHLNGVPTRNHPWPSKISNSRPMMKHTPFMCSSQIMMQRKVLKCFIWKQSGVLAAMWTCMRWTTLTSMVLELRNRPNRTLFVPVFGFVIKTILWQEVVSPSGDFIVSSIAEWHVWLEFVMSFHALSTNHTNGVVCNSRRLRSKKKIVERKCSSYIFV